MSKEQFISLIKIFDIDINDQILNQLEKYYAYLISENNKYNLTAITNKDQVYLKHFYDSLTICAKVKFKAGDNLVDIGTGAGFPGVILKIFNPDINITLIDSNNKKVTFLNNLIQLLGLKDITAICSRSEDYAQLHREQFDYVTARAVAPLNILLELAIPLLKINGSFIAMKAKKNSAEINDGLEAAKILGCSIDYIDEFVLPIEESDRTIIKTTKLDKTPIMYPRDYSKIIKNPLKKSLK